MKQISISAEVHIAEANATISFLKERTLILAQLLADSDREVAELKERLQTLEEAAAPQPE